LALVFVSAISATVFDLINFAGFGENNTGVLLNDYQRVKFMSNYLDALKRAMR